MAAWVAVLPQPGKLKQCKIQVLSSHDCFPSLQCFVVPLWRFWAFPGFCLAVAMERQLWPAPEATCVTRGHNAPTVVARRCRKKCVCVCVCIAKLSAIYFIFSKKNLCIKFRKITDNLPQPWGGYSLLCVVSQVGMLHFYKIKTFQLLFVPEPTEMEQTFKYKSPFLMLNSFL